jgi:clan AA aspartic protease
MIIGIVNTSLEATIPLALLGPAGQQLTIDAVVDTGFSESLTAPPHVIAALGLPYRYRRRSILADGSVVEFDIYRATVIWNGSQRRILVHAADTDPLVGMRLLFRHEVRFQAIVGGMVTVEALP